MILVTGGTGFIGGHLLERLSALELPVKCLVRKRAVARRLPAGVRAEYGDLTTGQGLAEAVEGVDTVIHLAGVTKALKPEDYYLGNVRATERLTAALASRPVRMVHVSSLAAVGPSSNGEPVDEDTTPHPITTYGKSKLEAERIVRSGMPDAVVVRPPVVYGPRDSDVFQVLKSVAHGLVLELAGGERWFSTIYVQDLVEGLLMAARAPNAAGGTYFLAHSKPASWSELGLAAARIMGHKARVVHVPIPLAYGAAYCAEVWAHIGRKPGIVSREKVAEAECMSWVCDTRRAAADLGFEAATPLETGLARTLAWYKEAGWLKY